MSDPANPGAIGLSVLGKASFGYVRGAGATGVSTVFSITNGVFEVPVLEGGPTTARGPSSVP